MSLGLLGPPSQSQLESALLPLTPSAELDDHSLAVNTRDPLKNSNVNPSHNLPDNTHLLEEDPSEDFFMGLNAEDNLGTFNMNLLTQGLVDTMEGSPCSQYASSLESLPSFGVHFHSRNVTPSSLTPSPEGHSMTPSSIFMFDKEEDINDDEDGLLSPLSDLLEDAILDEMRLLDLALEEGFSPEMAAKLEEEGFLDREIAQQETSRDDDHSGSGMVVTEDQGQPRGHQQGN